MLLWWTVELLVIHFTSVYMKMIEIPKAILDDYRTFCGADTTCNGRSSSSDDFDDSRFRQCGGPCSCEKLSICFKSPFCCPDYFIPGRVSSEDFTEWNYPHVYGYGIDTCPDEADTTLKKLCSINWKDIANKEFYGVTFNEISYKNKYCAICNIGEQHWHNWSLSARCSSQGFSPHIYSSVDALISAIPKFNCELELVDYSSLSFGTNLINQCNVTGLWDIKNSETELACKHYLGQSFDVFKNVFCFFCNTFSSFKGQYIEDCISHDDEILEENCLNSAPFARSYPYKNTYCKACNRLFPDEWSYRVNMLDINSKSYNWLILITLDLCYIRRLDVYEYLKLSQLLERSCNEKIINRNESIALLDVFEKRHHNNTSMQQTTKFNMSDLYNEYLRYGGESKWCHLGSGMTSCGCDSNCFASGNCCPDVGMLAESTCQKYGNSSTLVITKCQSPHPDKVMEYYCERDSDEYETLIDFFPVYSPIRQIHYKNIFCLLCSEKSDYVYDLYDASTWEMYLECNEYVMDVGSYILFAKYYKEIQGVCNIKYEPSMWDKKQSCSNTNDSNSFTSDIQHMCNFGKQYIFSNCKSKYDNVFCEMDSLHQTCPIPSCEIKFDSDSYYNCTNQESDFMWPDMGFHEVIPIDFSNAISESKMNKKLSPECEKDEVYDQAFDKCRKIICVPGKILVGVECMPLLKESSGYGAYTDLRVKVLESAEGDYDLQNVLKDLAEAVYFRYIIDGMVTSEVDVITYQPCSSRLSSNDSSEIYLQVKLESLSAVSREDIDRNLRVHVKPSFEIRVSGFLFDIKESDEDLWNQFNEFRNEQSNNFCESPDVCCTRGRFSFIFSLNHSYYYFKINEFLYCPQFILEKGEYQIIDSKTLTVSRFDEHHNISYTSKYGEQVRVCTTDYPLGGSPNKAFSVSSNLITFFVFLITLIDKV